MTIPPIPYERHCEYINELWDHIIAVPGTTEHLLPGRRDVADEADRSMDIPGDMGSEAIFRQLQPELLSLDQSTRFTGFEGRASYDPHTLIRIGSSAIVMISSNRRVAEAGFHSRDTPIDSQKQVIHTIAAPRSAVILGYVAPDGSTQEGSVYDKPIGVKKAEIQDSPSKAGILIGRPLLQAISNQVHHDVSWEQFALTFDSVTGSWNVRDTDSFNGTRVAVPGDLTPIKSLQ